MTDTTAENILDTLAARYEGDVRIDDRKGYEGLVVEAQQLLPLAKSLKGEFGYDYLSSVTGVDYLPEDRMEVVYHLYRSAGGPALVLKVQTGRADSSVPSLTPVYPGADFQEREAWDLLGIRFPGHPYLKRILMWEGFEGHPLRKDWQEAYFEADGKPFKTRWPDGKVHRVEDTRAFHKNVQYPSEFSPEGWVPEGDSGLYASLGKIDRKSTRLNSSHTDISRMPSSA